MEEIDRLIDSIDLSTAHGVRNAAMLELLYSCGLRVSECCELKYEHIFLEHKYLRVMGKGSKERLIPMSDTAVVRIEDYIPIRQEIHEKPGFRDYLFLSRLGRPLSRQMVFMVIKELAKEAGIQKPISPHTLRHPPAGGRRLPLRHQGYARACRHRHDGDLHPRRAHRPPRRDPHPPSPQ